MNRGISRLTSSQMRARAIAYEEAADHLERGLDHEDEDSPQEEAVAKHCRTLARMWGRRADKGPVKTQRRAKAFKPFWVRVFESHPPMLAGSSFEVTGKWRRFYLGVWRSRNGEVKVRVPKAICSIG